jgi:hypothetical protein
VQNSKFSFSKNEKGNFHLRVLTGAAERTRIQYLQFEEILYVYGYTARLFQVILKTEPPPVSAILNLKKSF